MAARFQETKPLRMWPVTRPLYRGPAEVSG